MLHRTMGRAVPALMLAAVAACSGEPTRPDDQAPDLAAALDELTLEAARQGDTDAGAAFGMAATAVRLGIRPTPIAVRVGDATARYLAFVHVVTHGSGERALRLRTMVAWHGDGRPERILYLAALADDAPLGHPTASLERRTDVRQLAWASWKDLVNRQIWVATSGSAGISEVSVGGACPAVAGQAGVQCTAGTFGVHLAGRFQRLVDGQRGQVDAASGVGIAARGDVSGAVLVVTGR
jgi:hypothetical protein